jgi:hypothetical protein
VSDNTGPAPGATNSTSSSDSGAHGIATDDELAAAIAPQTATTTNLTSLAAAVNTTGKTAGKTVFNTTLGQPVWASGSSAASTWVYADGTTAHTPA